MRRVKAGIHVFAVIGIVWATVQVSLAASPGAMPVPPEVDTSPPEQTTKLVFIHASVGGRWLSSWLGGGNDKWPLEYWDISLGGNNYYVSDYAQDNHPELPGHGYCTWPTLFSDADWMDVFVAHNAVEAEFEWASN